MQLTTKKDVYWFKSTPKNVEACWILINDLGSGETHYDKTKLECHIVIWAVLMWEPHVEEKLGIVRTEHQALKKSWISERVPDPCHDGARDIWSWNLKKTIWLKLFKRHQTLFCDCPHSTLLLLTLTKKSQLNLSKTVTVEKRPDSAHIQHIGTNIWT